MSLENLKAHWPLRPNPLIIIQKKSECVQDMMYFYYIFYGGLVSAGPHIDWRAHRVSMIHCYTCTVTLQTEPSPPALFIAIHTQIKTMINLLTLSNRVGLCFPLERIYLSPLFFFLKKDDNKSNEPNITVHDEALLGDAPPPPSWEPGRTARRGRGWKWAGHNHRSPQADS